MRLASCMTALEALGDVVDAEVAGGFGEVVGDLFDDGVAGVGDGVDGVAEADDDFLVGDARGGCRPRLRRASA